MSINIPDSHLKEAFLQSLKLIVIVPLVIFYIPIMLISAIINWHKDNL